MTEAWVRTVRHSNKLYYVCDISLLACDQGIMVSKENIIIIRENVLKNLGGSVMDMREMLKWFREKSMHGAR